MQGLPQLNFREIELRMIVILFSNVNIFKINIWDLFHIMKIILYVNLQCLLQTIGQNALLMLLKRGTQGHIDQFEI